MQLPQWDRSLQSWDRFKAFHIHVGRYGLEEYKNWANQPMVMFDTGEVIFTDRSPRPNVRGHYNLLGLEVVTSKDIKGPLYTPDGQKIAVAWLYEDGQESLLVDDDTGRVVRISDSYHDRERVVPGIPHRFQRRCTAYIPGPGMPPIGTGKIVVWLPFKVANLTSEQKAHIQMLTDTARAALKLTNHAITRTHYGSPGIVSGCPLDVLLATTSYLDLADAHLGALYHHGAQRKRVEYDYLLTEQPAC
jgi:hypothetical protein